MAQVFIRASRAHTTLGNNDLKSDTFAAKNIQQINTFERSVDYYAMHGVPTEKSLQDLQQLLVSQINQALQSAGISFEDYPKTGILLGSTSLDIGTVSPKEGETIWLSYTDHFSHFLKESFGFHRLDYTFNTACTASANALLYGARLIKDNVYKHAVVVGCEFFNNLTVNGFSSLDLISYSSPKAFDETRDGLILGEGIGVVVLSSESNESCHFELLDGYSSCDDHSLTITEENGNHIVNVVEKALVNSKVEAKEVDVVKVHGTATLGNDLAEYNALKQLFDEVPPVIAYKPLTGHTLGACGAIELAMLDISSKASFAMKADYVDESETLMLNWADYNAIDKGSVFLLNHFGFGGNNAALLIKKLEHNE